MQNLTAITQTSAGNVTLASGKSMTIGGLRTFSGTATGAFMDVAVPATRGGLKIHSHSNQNNSGGTYDYTFINEFKGEFVSTSGVMNGIGAVYNMAASGTGVMSAAYAQAILNAAITLSGTSATGSWISGGLFSCDLKGTSVLNGTAVLALGLYAEVVSAINSTLTEAKHVAAICGMGKLLVKPTTGECSLLYLCQAAGATTINQAIYLEGGATIDAFATIDVAASGKAIATSVVALGSGSTNTTHALKINIGGTAGYIPVYAAANFA